MPKIGLEDDVMRPLTAWVHGENFYMKSFIHYEGEVILPETVFVSIIGSFQIHEAPNVPLKTLCQSWVDTKNYVLAACKLLGRERAGYSLSVHERASVLAELGQPPEPSWPLYFLAVGDYPEEEIVYVGKTNSKTHRFTAGHAAITALHRPEYENRAKRLYFATVTIYSDEGNYVPLEWIHPKPLRDAIWKDLEAQLIFYFQPALNDRLKKRDHSERPIQIAFHNYSGTKSFDGWGIPAHRQVDDSEWHDFF